MDLCKRQNAFGGFTCSTDARAISKSSRREVRSGVEMAKAGGMRLLTEALGASYETILFYRHLDFSQVRCSSEADAPALGSSEIPSAEGLCMQRFTSSQP